MQEKVPFNCNKNFFGDYIPQGKDIYKNFDDFEIEVVLECDENYISDFF